jgi:putative flippase GtrA
MKMPIRHEAMRFLIAGVTNTSATYVIYLTLLPMLSYTAAYTIAYVIGIALAYALNTWFVFRVPRNVRGMLLFPLVYIVQYLIGVGTLNIAAHAFGVPQKFALLPSLAVSIPVTYIISRYVLKPHTVATHTPPSEMPAP